MRLLVVLQCFLLCHALAYGTSLRITPDQQTIQSAIDSSLENDTILLSPGLYDGDGNRDINFGSKNLVVLAEPGAGLVTVDCSGTEGTPHRAFLFDGGQNSSTVIAGLTIRSGYGLSDNALGVSVGGAILCVGGSSPTISDCTFYGNRSGFGGTAIFLTNNSSPEITNCLFTANVGVRGAVTANASSPVISNCEFRQNIGERGSCIYLTSNASPIIDNCSFIENQSIKGGAIMYGNSFPSITNSIFWKNSSSSAGGAIWSGGSSLSNITNCTIVLSDSPTGAAIFAEGESSITITNSNISMSSGSSPIECDANGTVKLTCSNIAQSSNGNWIGCIASQANTGGNMTVDPIFCDAPSGFLWPLANSPLAPENNQCGILIGALEVGLDNCLCCVGFTGNIDCDPNGMVDISDLTSLIDHLFIGFTPLCCINSANINGDSSNIVDIIDLTVLVDHLFIGFTKTAICRN